MRLAALLCWWDEPAAMLDRCVRSLAGVADEVIALDGAWAHLEGGMVCSPIEQSEAIHAAASAIGITATTVGTTAIWPSQIEKRAALMECGRDSGADWLLVIDADDYVAKVGALFRHTLAWATEDVATFPCHYMIGRRAACRSVRRLFRASTGVTVTGAHNGYQAADGRWLHAPSNIETVPALNLHELLVTEHDSTLRNRARQHAMAAYYESRGLRGEETLRTVAS